MSNEIWGPEHYTLSNDSMDMFKDHERSIEKMMEEWDDEADLEWKPSTMPIGEHDFCSDPTPEKTVDLTSEEEDEEVFPTSRQEVKEEPVIRQRNNSGTTPHQNHSRPPPPPQMKLPQGLDKMFESVMKMFPMEEDSKELDLEKEEIKAIPLRPLGYILRSLALVFFSFLGWLLDCLKDRMPLNNIASSFHKTLMVDIEEGLWNDIFDTPEEFLEDTLHPKLFWLLETLFEIVHFLIENNRVFVPILTFFLGVICAL